jgi:hypothetical protein
VRNPSGWGGLESADAVDALQCDARAHEQIDPKDVGVRDKRLSRFTFGVFVTKFVCYMCQSCETAQRAKVEVSVSIQVHAT